MQEGVAGPLSRGDTPALLKKLEKEDWCGISMRMSGGTSASVREAMSSMAFTSEALNFEGMWGFGVRILYA
jgi:hypothetical protein